MGPHTKLCVAGSNVQPVGIETGSPKALLAPKGRPASRSEAAMPVVASRPAAIDWAELGTASTELDGDVGLVLLPQPTTNADSTATPTSKRIRFRFIRPPTLS